MLDSAGHEPPGQSRFTAEWRDGAEWLLVSPRKRLLVSLFMLVWLGGWSIGFVAAARDILAGERLPFLLFWFAGWTIGGAFVIALLAWGMLGRCGISISAGTLSFQWRLLVFSRTRRFDVAHISNLRVGLNDSRWGDFGLPPFLPGANMHGGVRFDYGLRTVTIMSGLDEAEYAMVVDWIETRLPRRT